MLALALIGLNLAGATTTCGYLQRPRPSGVALGPRVRPSDETNAEGNTRFDLGKLDTGERLVRLVERPSLQPTLLEVWSPLIASVSITILVLVVPLRLSGSRRWSTLPSADGPISSRLHRAWIAGRCATIAAALVGLNIAGAVFRPFINPADQRPLPFELFDQFILPDGGGSLFLTHRDGRLFKSDIHGKAERPATLSDFPLAVRQGDAESRVAETVVYKRDGSIVVYDGSPGLLARILLRSRVLQPQARSFTETWWPLLSSASITALTVVHFQRQPRHTQRTIAVAPQEDAHCAGSF